MMFAPPDTRSLVDVYPRHPTETEDDYRQRIWSMHERRIDKAKQRADASLLALLDVLPAAIAVIVAAVIGYCLATFT